MTLDRRRLLGQAGLAGLGVALSARALIGRPAEVARPAPAGLTAPLVDPGRLAAEYDYVVIGSGAGGGPVAVRLAEAGHTVLVLEAGPGEVPPDEYAVPAFHLLASSHPELTWDFYVRHYSDPRRHGRRWQAGRDGMLYPRAAAIGGCTAHHAMLTMAPEDDDWSEAVRVTGDPRWNPHAMQRHLRAVRDWLPIEQVPPTLLLADRTLARLVAAAAVESGLPFPRPGQEVDLNTMNIGGLLPDPNDPAHVRGQREGLFLIPQSTKDGQRRGVRERLLESLPQLNGRLTIQTDALVERIVLDTDQSGQQRATAVAFRHGRHLYQASPRFRADTPWRQHAVRVRREVIVAGGTFNSPQVLMLSGIGPAPELHRHGITPRVELPAVGTNLQDRYEMTVVDRFGAPFDVAARCTFGEADDPCLADWRRDPGAAVYRSNGIVVGVKLRLTGARYPEVFLFGSPSRFEGYEPGFAVKGLADHRYFTWAVLKGWSGNRTGTVRLRSADPTASPEINFRYFDDGAGGTEDLDAVLAGIDHARRINRRARQLAWLDQADGTEVFPGGGLVDRADLHELVRREAWGHHASCSNPMGRRDDGRSVVDGRLRVHGTSNVRVVDASVFARIPGLYPVLAIYTLAEKAAADILADARNGPP
jgi:choline dehydrogenase